MSEFTPVPESESQEHLPKPKLVRVNAAIHHNHNWDLLNDHLQPIDVSTVATVSPDSVIDLTMSEDEDIAYDDASEASQDELCLCVFDDHPDLCISCNHKWTNHPNMIGLSYDATTLRRPFRVIIDVEEDCISYDYMLLNDCE